MNWKAAVKLFFLKLGVDVRSTKSTNEYLSKFDIDLVLDIGANKGQFAYEVLTSGYSGRIVSFEPTRSLHENLKKQSKRYDNWEIYKRCALGSECGMGHLNLSENTQSSSLLDIDESHILAAPDSRIVGQELVEIITLDRVLIDDQYSDYKIYVKIDTQGFEEAVLDGFTKEIDKVRLVSLELSTTGLYVGAPYHYELLKRMHNLGFGILKIEPVFVDKNSGVVLQFDVLFVNNSFL